jgi:hypothetical protein
MLTMHNGIIWYTGWDDNSESLGMMNPSEVQFSSSLRLSNNQSIDNLSFNCLTVTQSGSFTATISTLTPTWSQNYINQVPSNIGGWSVYSFDYAVLYGGMFGITYNDGSIWAVDNDRHKLIRHIIEPVNPPTDWVYLPLVIR